MIFREGRVGVGQRKKGSLVGFMSKKEILGTNGSFSFQDQIVSQRAPNKLGGGE